MQVSESPCADYAKESYKCLDKNNYNHDLCQDTFEAYKECKRRDLEARRAKREQAQREKKGWFS